MSTPSSPPLAPPRVPRLKLHADERRTSPRQHFSADLTFSSENNFYAGKARDISTGGLFFETTAALEVGTRIWIRFALLGDAFAVTAKVCWVQADRVGRPRGAGVRFLHVPEPMREAIAAFMVCRAPIQFEVEASGELPESEPPGPPRRG
jgi:uncharacterized protein (TIGR02266 family)